MGGRTHIAGNGMQAYEWEFDAFSLIWKIVHNPEFAHLPSCISVFTTNIISHGHVQQVLDPLFEPSMGRGGANTFGNSHDYLHVWINEAANLADIHPHDHFVIGNVGNKRTVIARAVAALVGINYIRSPAYDVIQYLQSGR